MGQRMTESPLALFAGGVFGGFLILGLIPPELNLGIKRQAIERLALPWSLLSGVIAVVGWAMGPLLGMTLWSLSHALHLTAPTETFQNAAYGGTAYQYSLYPVWQTGTAFVLGVVLRRYESKSRQKETEHP